MGDRLTEIQESRVREFERYKKSFLKDFVMTSAATEVGDLIVYDCGKEQCVKDKHVSPISKPYYLFHFIEQGTGTFVQNGNVYDVKAGDAFVIFPWQEKFEYYTSKNQPWLYKWFSVGGSLADLYIAKAGIGINNPIIKGSKVAGFREAVNDLVNMYLENGNINLGCIACLYMIFHCLLEQSHKEKKSKYENHYVNEAIMFISYNANLPIEVVDVANSINLNQRYFINLFYKHVGLTPKQYIVKVKMEIAKENLKDKNAKITEVASTVGYNDPFHFSREFKKYYGVSPKKYQLSNENKQ